MTEQDIQTTEAPGSETGAEDANANLTVDDLTATFVKTVGRGSIVIELGFDFEGTRSTLHA